MPVVYARSPFSANVLLDDGRVIYVSLIRDPSTGDLEIAVFPRRWIHRLAALLWPLGGFLLPSSPKPVFWNRRFPSQFEAQRALDAVCHELESGTLPERLRDVLH